MYKVRLLLLLVVSIFITDLNGQKKEIEIPKKTCNDCTGKLLGDSAILKVDHLSDSIPPMNRVFNNYSYDLYDILQKNWIAFEDLNYLTGGPVIESIGDRHIELREGEGESGRVQLLEANFGFRMPIAMGRKSHAAIFRRMRLTLDYSANFRMTLDNSKPLTPWSNRVGFGYDFNFWDNYTNEKWAWDQWCIDENHPIDVPNATKDLNSVNLRILLHHYSNGQPDGFHYYPAAPDSTIKRNDYISGDFSTNYLDLLLSWNSININPRNPKRKHSMNTWSFGYRVDLGTADGIFAYSPEQNNSYGRHRLRVEYDYRTGPWSRGVFTWHQQDGQCYLMKRTYELHWRTAFEVIADGDLSNFQANLLNDKGEIDDRDFRWNIRSQLELAPLNSRAIGVMLMAYYGRDYLNIRYDDIVWSVQLGLTFNLNKYFPTTWNSGEAVTHKLKTK